MGDKEELIDRVKAQMGIMRFMQTSMHGKMRELSELRVRKWELRNKSRNDYQAIKSGTSSIEQSNELRKLKQQTKKLAQVMVKIRKEIPKRKQEVKKYKNRVELLQSQYQQYSQQPLP